MKTTFYKAFSAATITVLFFGCKPDIEVPAAEKGNIDATKYVAIGNSLTAGYADNALYQEAQLSSYPNLIAQQLKAIGGGEFKQPLVDAASVGVGASMNARYRLSPSADCMGTVSLMPSPIATSGDLAIWGTSVAAQGPFNNMAVPGLKTVTTVYPGYGDYTKGSGNFNPYYTRISANPAGASILSEAASQNPSFFTLAIGNEDVMAYAIAGGAADGITPVSGPVGFGFDETVDAIVGTLAAGGAKGVIAGVPSLKTMPYFTTVPYNGLMLDEANATALTSAYSGLGITFTAGSNGFIIEDAAAPGGMRQITEGEMILLSVPQDSLKCAGWGSMKAIPHQFVLTATEVTEIETAITNYNTKLEAAAMQFSLGYVDMNAFFNRLQKGIVYNGISMNAAYVTGGSFSLDGIHLTPRGNALLANEFIKVMNNTFKASIPMVDVTKYRGVVFP